MSFKMSFVVLALFAAYVSGRPYAEEMIQFDCNGRVAGYYADESDPKAFFSCMEGQLVARVACEEGFVFDGIEGCVPEEVKFNVVENQEGQEVENEPSERYPPGEEDDDNEEQFRLTKKKIFNIEISKNIFPNSVIIIGKMNREQKNK